MIRKLRGVVAWLCVLVMAGMAGAVDNGLSLGWYVVVALACVALFVPCAWPWFCGNDTNGIHNNLTNCIIGGLNMRFFCDCCGKEILTDDYFLTVEDLAEFESTNDFYCMGVYCSHECCADGLSWDIEEPGLIEYHSSRSKLCLEDIEDKYFELEEEEEKQYQEDCREQKALESWYWSQV